MPDVSTQAAMHQVGWWPQCHLRHASTMWIHKRRCQHVFLLLSRSAPVFDVLSMNCYGIFVQVTEDVTGIHAWHVGVDLVGGVALQQSKYHCALVRGWAAQARSRE